LGRRDDCDGVFDLKIRAAQSHDAEKISDLISVLSRKFIVSEFSIEGAEFLLSTMTQSAIEDFMQSGYVYHVAEIDNSLAGVVGVRDHTHLYHLFVAEQFHRKGIAKKLWQVAMQVCLANGNPGEFTVNSSAYARDAYKKLGFVAQSGPKEKGGVVFFPMKMTIDGQA
jgi:GNAT superfamily N-acetyltransferase